jgi:hypothetical protein
MVNKERMELWVQALESDEYQQCTGSLFVAKYKSWTTIKGEVCFAQQDHHCALGVAIAVALKNGMFNGHPNPPDDVLVYNAGGGELPSCVRIWYGLSTEDPPIRIDDNADKVSHFNDNGQSFWTIAQALRATYLKDEERPWSMI